MPPCTRGWRVLTRPSSISGNPVTASTSVTGRPASRMVAPVEPVETISAPASWRARARSTIPVLSKTETRARRMGRRSVVSRDVLLSDRCDADSVRYGSLPCSGHPGGRCPQPSLPGGVPPAPVVCPHSSRARVQAWSGCGAETAHDVDQQWLLGVLDALVEGVLGVVVTDVDRHLGEDPPGVDAGVDLDHARAGDLHTVGQGVADAMGAGE